MTAVCLFLLVVVYGSPALAASYSCVNPGDLMTTINVTDPDNSYTVTSTDNGYFGYAPGDYGGAGLWFTGPSDYTFAVGTVYVFCGNGPVDLTFDAVYHHVTPADPTADPAVIGALVTASVGVFTDNYAPLLGALVALVAIVTLPLLVVRGGARWMLRALRKLVSGAGW